MTFAEDGRLYHRRVGTYRQADDAETTRLRPVCYAMVPCAGAPTVASSTFDVDRWRAHLQGAPNYEKPADADKDNVYEVTITADRRECEHGHQDVKVTVTNAEEDGKGNPVSDPAAGRTGR